MSWCWLFHSWSRWHTIDWAYSAYEARICLDCHKIQTTAGNLIRPEDARKLREAYK